MCSHCLLTGGIEMVISLLQSDRFLAGADKQTRRSCLYIFAKITKFVVTTLCYGTLALLKVSRLIIIIVIIVVIIVVIIIIIISITIIIISITITITIIIIVIIIIIIVNYYIINI